MPSGMGACNTPDQRTTDAPLRSDFRPRRHACRHRPRSHPGHQPRACLGRAAPRGDRGNPPVCRAGCAADDRTRLRGDRGAGAAAADEPLYEAFIAYYAENIAVDSRPFPGTLELLDRLDDAGVKLGICTNKQERLSLKLLDGLGLRHRFGAIIGADTIGIPKPDPAPYREAVARLEAGGGSVMIGDSETDILTARNAGVPVIAVTFGYTERHVREFAPDHVVDHMDHVWPAIAGYLPKP